MSVGLDGGMLGNGPISDPSRGKGQGSEPRPAPCSPASLQACLAHVRAAMALHGSPPLGPGELLPRVLPRFSTQTSISPSGTPHLGSALVKHTPERASEIVGGRSIRRLACCTCPNEGTTSDPSAGSDGGAGRRRLSLRCQPALSGAGPRSVAGSGLVPCHRMRRIGCNPALEPGSFST
jgi:hypothetical protein